MELQLFIYKNIALHLYYSKDSVRGGRINTRNIYIYYPGLPQTISGDFFADKVDKDTAFFSVHYSGSWLSGGSFTYENCKKTIELSIEFVRHRKGIKTFDNKQINWDYRKLHVIGYSFSGNPVVSARISKVDVENVFLLAPLLFLNKADVAGYLQDDKAINDFYDFNSFYLEFLRRGYRFALRGIEKLSWDKYFSGKATSSFVKMAEDYPNIIIFHGRSDEKINYKSSLYFQKNKHPEAKVSLVDNVGHDLEKLFDAKAINGMG